MDFQTSKFREITTKTPDPHDSSKTLELNWFTDLDEKSLIVEESTIKRITDPEFANSVAFKTGELKKTALIHKFGSAVTINDFQYWKLSLASKALKVKYKKNISIANVIKKFTNFSLGSKNIDDLTIPLAYTETSDDVLIIRSYLNKYVVTQEGPFALGLASLTYHQIPAIRSLYLALIEPQLLDVEDLFHITSFLKETKDIHWVDLLDELNEKLGKDRLEFQLLKYTNYPKSKEKSKKIDELDGLISICSDMLEEEWTKNFNPSELQNFLANARLDFQTPFNAINKEYRKLRIELGDSIKSSEVLNYEGRPYSSPFVLKRLEHELRQENNKKQMELAEVYEKIKSIQHELSAKKFLLTGMSSEQLEKAITRFELLKDLEKKIAGHFTSS
tara:strand:- start:1937 stop:3106 length:1170 start_codon:yes stop_codon:yes gene_type:complete